MPAGNTRLFFLPRRKRRIWLFFGSFYAAYLLSLLFVVRLGYKFAYQFWANGDFGGLFRSIEGMIVPFVINLVVVGVLGGLLTHWFLNKDAIGPTETELDDEPKNLENK